MTRRLLSLALLITSMLGYLEWGTDQHAFLFQVEYELLFGANRRLSNFLHPLILLPSAGQLLLVTAVLQRAPGRKLTLAGLACLSVIVLMILLVGALRLNVRILLSTVPFVMVAVVMIRSLRKTH